MAPKVSVIVPVYNTEKYIEKCSRSLFGQTLDEIEYIFVNDCTPDRSIDIVRQTLEEYPHRKSQVKIIEQPVNKGVGAARKAGLEAATGDYISQCDSDDWVETAMYEKMYAKALEKDADIVCCNFYKDYQDRSLINTAGTMTEECMADPANLQTVHIVVTNKLIRRTLYTDHHILPFDGVNMWDDIGLNTRLRFFSKKNVMMPDAFYHFNCRNMESMCTMPLKISGVEERIRCAQGISDFFRLQSAEYKCVTPPRQFSQLETASRVLQFQSKSAFLLNKGLRDIRRWKNTFPESNRKTWKQGNFSKPLKIVYRIATAGFPRIACMLWDIRSYIKRN